MPERSTQGRWRCSAGQPGDSGSWPLCDLQQVLTSSQPQLPTVKHDSVYFLVVMEMT